MAKGLFVFAVTYLLVATRRLRLVRLDRPAGALAGAVLAVALKTITPEQAGEAVDKTTIVLLFAVMGIGAFLSNDGFFDRAGRYTLDRVRTVGGLVGVVVWSSGLLSAVVTNDAVCVLAAPIVVGWIDHYRLPRLPLLLALATGANTGSVATLVGNPQNILCGSLGGLKFTPFMLHMLPVAVVALAINHGILLLLFRKEVREDIPRASRPPPAKVFTPKSILTLGVLFGTVVFYVAGGNLAFTALGGFVLLLLFHRSDPNTIWARIDWSVLLFFGGLFIAVDAFARSGAAEWAFERVPLLAGAGTLGWMRPAAIFLVGSNVVTNVPFILIVKPEMAHLRDVHLGWEMLAMASTFAGNLTLVGSVANIIVAEKAERVGGLSFLEHLKVGLPLALVTTGVGALILAALR